MKKLKIFIAILSFSLLFVALTTHAGPVVVFGDSLAYGQGSYIDSNGLGELHRRIAQELNCKVLNLGIVGETSSESLARLSEITETKTDLVIMSTAGNDVIQDLFGNGFPESLTFSNMDKIFKRLQASNIDVVFLGLDPIDLETEKKNPLFKRLPAIESIANKYSNVIFIKESMKEIWGNEILMADEIHPNDKGYRLIADKVIESLSH